MSKRVKTSLLDNLWLWGMLAFSIMAFYGIWVLFEVMGMHGISLSPHHP